MLQTLSAGRFMNESIVVPLVQLLSDLSAPVQVCGSCIFTVFGLKTRNCQFYGPIGVEKGGGIPLEFLNPRWVM